MPIVRIGFRHYHPRRHQQQEAAVVGLRKDLTVLAGAAHRAVFDRPDLNPWLALTRRLIAR